MSSPLSVDRVHEAFCQTLRELRLERNMSQEQLAFECNMDRTAISLLERGQRSPRLKTIVRLARALDISLMEWIAQIESRAKRNHKR